MNYEESKKMYSEILSILDKYSDNCIYDIRELKQKSECHLFGLKLKEVYGLGIDPKRINSIEYIRFGEYMSIGMWGEKYRRTISWSDDDRQPKDELLLCIGFSTGAYIFGQDYPTDLFQKFFNELKTYKPKYTDTSNKNLFYSMDNAKEIFNSFNDILKKYHDLNKDDFKQRKIKELGKQLEYLSLKQ
jgi:hypothetical protein